MSVAGKAFHLPEPSCCKDKHNVRVCTGYIALASPTVDVFSVFWVMVRGLGTLQFATGRLFSDDRFFFDSCVEDGGYICDRNGFCDMFTLGLRGDMGGCLFLSGPEARSG